jgi:mono/diheme cytochrome c family protein
MPFEANVFLLATMATFTIPCLRRSAMAVALLGVMTVTACASLRESKPTTSGADIRAGRVLSERYCAQCHAIGLTGDSPHPAAPRFRNLSERYPIDSLATRFAARISTHHPDMPQWQFDPDQDRQMISFLKSIQRPSRSR